MDELKEYFILYWFQSQEGLFKQGDIRIEAEGPINAITKLINLDEFSGFILKRVCIQESEYDR